LLQSCLFFLFFLNARGISLIILKKKTIRVLNRDTETFSLSFFSEIFTYFVSKQQQQQKKKSILIVLFFFN